MTDVLSAEDIKKAVGAFSGECSFFFLFPPLFSPLSSLQLRIAVHLFKLREDRRMRLDKTRSEDVLSEVQWKPDRFIKRGAASSAKLPSTLQS